MKKILSLMLAFLMLMSISPITLAAEISSEGISVAGWNGWSVADGTAVTTNVNPLTTDTEDRGDMVKIENGSASRYFAQWFTGVIELSVDVYGTGTLNFHDANDRTAGEITLANGAINDTLCDYNAAAWNTIKLFVMTGTNKAEVYLDEEYVTEITLSGLVRPTTLTVTTEDTIYVDNIVVKELNKTNAYEDGELSVVKEINSESFSGWTSTDAVNTATDSTTFEGEKVYKVEKATATGTAEWRYEFSDTVGTFVFEAELNQAKLPEGTTESTVDIFARNNTATGRMLNLVSFGTDGYVSLGYDEVSSKQFIDEPLYTPGEWFKIKLEVITENQSVILYVDKECDGTYIRVNDVPVRIYHAEGVTQNAESYQCFKRFGFNFATGASKTATWYVKSAKISTPRTDEKEVTLLEENFDDATTDFVYTDGELTEGTYKGKQLESNATGGERSGVGKLWFNYHNDSYKHVGEDVAEEITDFTDISETGKKSDNISSAHYYTVNFDESIDLTDALGIKVSYDYYDAAICRKVSSGATNDTLNVTFIDGAKTSVFSHTMQNSNMYCKPDGGDDKYSVDTKVKRTWDTASDKRTVYASGNNSTISANGSTKKFKTTTLTQEKLSSIAGIKFSTSKNIGGLYYIDNLKVTATLPLGNGYIRKGYSTILSTLEDNITRGNVSDIKLGYVEFADSEGVVKGGMPVAGGKVSSVSIVKNADISAEAKLLVSVYDGETLTGCETFEITNEKTYTLTKNLSTTANSVVKAFIWDMGTLTPLTDDKAVNNGKRTKLVLFGDSIVCEYAETSITKGWGQLLGNYVDTNELEILNYAAAGMTTSHYLNMGEGEEFDKRNAKYTEALGLLEKGDYAMISLATNDAKDEYGLSSGGKIVEDYQTEKSFIANLYQMVRDIEAEGATPILVTTHPRCKYINNVNRFELQGGKEQNNSDQDGAYQKMINDMRRLADKKGIALIDLYEMAIDEYDKGVLGEYQYGSNTYYLNLDVFENYVAFTENSVDFTHLNAKGADFAASLVAEGMAQLNCGIEKFVR